ncbi:MAG: hypothetical protein AAFO04_04270 [Cyanobacteria bacterium J06592_8]
MSQSSAVKPTKSSDSPLPSTLKGVLSSLDVQLEDELTRYRRYRRQTTPASTTEKPSRSYTQKPSEVLSVSEQESQIEPSADRASQKSKSSTSQIPSGWESVVIPEPAPLAPHSTNSETQSSSFYSNPQNTSFTPTTPQNNEPDGYLESSQQLVKSLEERRARRRQRNWATTPLGLLSLFLFFLSCIGLGYLVMSPSGMAILGLDRWFKDDAQIAEEAAEANRLAGAAQPQPNLAAREFVELDLDTLSNINPNPAPIPVAPQTPAANSQNLTPPSPLPSGPGMNNLTNELLPDPVPPTPKPAAPVQTVTPKPGAGAATKPKTNPIQASDGLYYVVTTYSNPQSLEKARTVIADAYVRDFKTGKKVQLGALDNPGAAKRLAEQLRVQGIAVQFDTPKTGE